MRIPATTLVLCLLPTTAVAVEPALELLAPTWGDVPLDGVIWLHTTGLAELSLDGEEWTAVEFHDDDGCHWDGEGRTCPVALPSDLAPGDHDVSGTLTFDDSGFGPTPIAVADRDADALGDAPAEAIDAWVFDEASPCADFTGAEGLPHTAVSWSVQGADDGGQVARIRPADTEKTARFVAVGAEPAEHTTCFEGTLVENGEEVCFVVDVFDSTGALAWSTASTCFTAAWDEPPETEMPFVDGTASKGGCSHAPGPLGALPALCALGLLVRRRSAPAG